MKGKHANERETWYIIAQAISSTSFRSGRVLFSAVFAAQAAGAESSSKYQQGENETNSSVKQVFVYEPAPVASGVFDSEIRLRCIWRFDQADSI
jgi:hypothetical protein